MDVNLLLEQAYGFLKSGLGNVILFAIVIVATLTVEKIVRNTLLNKFEKMSKHINVDKTKFTFLSHILRAIIYVVGFTLAIYTIPPLRSIAVSLFAGAGILAAIVGFGSQKAVSNIVSGMFIALLQPFRVGDVIRFQDKIGKVEDITLRHTVVRNFENRRYVVPNSVMSDEIIENFHYGEEKTCRYVEFGISYDSDISKAMKIIQQEAEKHPFCIDNRTEEDIENNEAKVNVRVMGFSDSSVNLRGWAWAESPGNAFKMGTDLNKIIKERFEKEGIEIPFPYRTIVFKSDEEKKKSKKPKKKPIKKKK